MIIIIIFYINMNVYIRSSFNYDYSNKLVMQIIIYLINKINK